jgi:hypothetical protein
MAFGMLIVTRNRDRRRRGESARGDAAVLAAAIAFTSLVDPGVDDIPAPGPRVNMGPNDAGTTSRDRRGTPILVMGDGGPSIVALPSTAVIRTGRVLGWTGRILLALSGLAMFLSVAWRTPEVLFLAGVYGMTGMLVVIASAIAS